MARSLPLLLAGLFCALAPADAAAMRAVARTAQARVPRVAPLAQVGGMLRAVPSLTPPPGGARGALILPGASRVEAKPAAAAVAETAFPAAAAEAAAVSVPSDKARILLERAEASDPRGVAAASGWGIAETRRDAPRALAAVNSVLRDFSPQQLAELPAEQLQGFSQLILDQMTGKASRGRGAAAAVRALVEARAERLLPLLGRAPVERVTYDPVVDGKERQIEVDGVPPATIAGRSDGRTVFRHYTTRDGIAEIEKSRSLQNGFVSYVQRSAMLYHKSFKDLTGLFLTLPGVEGDRVGVPGSDFPEYVDIVLPAGMPLWELEKGAIYLVPLAVRTRGWVKDLYFRYLRGEPVSSAYGRTVDALQAEGGPGPDLAVPVKIVGSSTR